MQSIRTNRFGTSIRPKVGHTLAMLERHQVPKITIILLHIHCYRKRTAARQRIKTYI